MRRRPARSPRAGMTLLEVVISSAILSGLALVVMFAMLPLTSASSEQGAFLDMDRSATKFLTELRRELRQSGRNGATPLFGGATFSPLTLSTSGVVTNASGLWFRQRTGPSTFSSDVVYRYVTATGAQAPGVVQRTTPGTLPLADTYSTVLGQVSGLTFNVATGDQVCVVRLTLQRTNNRGVVLQRTYTERIEMMNR